MQRIVSFDYARAIRDGLDLIPDPITERLQHVEFLTGSDPVHAGLHHFEDASYGRSYRQTAHCCYAWHTSDRSTTIVLPEVPEPHTVVHELGHALHEVLDWPTVQPVTWYANTDEHEAFAESLTTWLIAGYGDAAALHADEPTLALFEQIAADE